MMIPNCIRRSAIDSLFWLYGRPFHKIIRSVPVSLAYRLSELMAFFFFLKVSPSIKPHVAALIRFRGEPGDDKELHRITRKACEIFVKRQIEDLFAGKIDSIFIRERVTFQGLEYVDRALNKGRGGILLTSHFGSFRMILPALAFHGYKVHQLAGNPILKHHCRGRELLFNEIASEYAHQPVNFIRVDHSLRPALRALQNNELVVISFDGREGKDWVDIPFLGRTGRLSSGPVRMAAMTGAPLLPLVAVRKSRDRHKIFIDNAIEVERDISSKAGIRSFMSRYVAFFEKYIKKYPCHFVMTIKTHQERYEKGIIDVPMLV